MSSSVLTLINSDGVVDMKYVTLAERLREERSDAAIHLETGLSIDRLDWVTGNFGKTKKDQEKDPRETSFTLATIRRVT